MTDFTSTLNGPPTGGFFTAGDQITDASGYVWRCVATGFAGSPGAPGTAYFEVVGLSDTAKGTVAAVTGLTAHDIASGLIHQTVLTLANVSQVIPNGGSEWVGTKIFTFPQKRIMVLGTNVNLAPTTHSTLSTTITTGTNGAFALGTVTNDGTLTTTKADHLASTSFTSSTTIDVAAAAVVAGLAAGAIFDGTTTAKDLFFNTVIATNTNDGTLLWNGTIKLTWVPLS